MNPSKYNKFHISLERARNGIIVREESLFLMESLTACMRKMALKLGDFLVKKSIISEATDVFFIFLSELRSATEGKIDVHERVEKRKKAFKKVYVAHEQGIHWMISTGSFPEFKLKKKKISKRRQFKFNSRTCCKSRHL